MRAPAPFWRFLHLIPRLRMSTLQLQIVTPERLLLDAQVNWVTVPGSEGEMGILPEHAPLMTSIITGLLTYEDEQGAQTTVAVHKGYAQVAENRVTILAEKAETAGDLKMDVLKDAEAKLREELAGFKADQVEKIAEVEAHLARIATRMMLLEGHKAH